MKITFYYQTIEREEVVDVGEATLEEALELFDTAPIVPTNPPPGSVETFGFLKDTGAFLEFVRINPYEYQTRYENPITGEAYMGILTAPKAREMLVDFFQGNELRWKNELEPY